MRDKHLKYLRFSLLTNPPPPQKCPTGSIPEPLHWRPRMRKELDLHVVSALLHTARETLLDQADRDPHHRRRLKVILAPVEAAIGAISRQGMTPDE